MKEIINSTSSTILENPPYLLLDSQFRIVAFSPALKSLVNVIETDIGRPISHFTTRFRGLDLGDLAQQTLLSQSPYLFCLESVDGRNYDLYVGSQKQEITNQQLIIMRFSEGNTTEQPRQYQAITKQIANASFEEKSTKRLKNLDEADVLSLYETIWQQMTDHHLVVYDKTLESVFEKGWTLSEYFELRTTALASFGQITPADFDGNFVVREELLRVFTDERRLEFEASLPTGEVFRVKVQSIFYTKGRESLGIISMQNITREVKIRNAVQFIAESTLNPRFFKEILNFLSQNLHLSELLVGQLSEDKAHIVARACYANGVYYDKYEYTTEHTPCEFVLQKQTVIYPDKVQLFFPQDQHFKQFNTVAYIGVPLIDGNDQTFGILTGTSSVSFTDSEMVSTIFNVFATRVAKVLEKENISISLRKSQENLAVREKYYQSLLEGAADIVSILDSDGIGLYHTPAIKSVLGYEPHEQDGKNVFDYVHPEDISFVVNKFLLLSASSQGSQLSLDFRMRTKDQKWKHLHCIGRNFLEDPDIRGIIVNSRDVTEFVEMRQNLSRSEDLFKNLYENSPIGVALSDLKGNIINPNHAFCRILGYTQDELEGNPISQLSHPDDRHREGQFAQRIFRDEIDYYKMEKRFFHKKGHTVYCNLYINAIRDRNRKILNIIGMIEDISEQKRAQEALLEINSDLERKVMERTAMLAASNEELSRFAYIASHDLKQPLRTIGNFVELLNRKYGNLFDERAKEYMNFVLSGVQNMRKLIDDLLEYAQTTNSLQSERFLTADADQMIADVLRLLDYQIQENRVEISAQKVKKMLLVVPSRFKQLLQNLISNAIKFRKLDAVCHIEIGYKCNDYEHIFSVTDNGIGIRYEDQEAVFGLFHKVHLRSNLEGNGIGLATCKRIIEQHKGRIWLVSEPNVGTTFYFSIPKIRS